MILIECLVSLHPKHFHFNNMITDKKSQNNRETPVMIEPGLLYIYMFEFT
jgi:hypothetical protein